MFRPCPTQPMPHSGFTLIEVMVGMLIGMLGMIVMTQVFLVSDANKRTSSGGGDAQTNGAGALFTLQRDIRQAGYGITSSRLLGCNVVLRSGVTLNAIAPLTINHASIPAGDPNTDTVLIVSSNANASPEGDTIILQAVQTNYSVIVPEFYSSGDWIIAVPPPALPAVACSPTLEQAVVAGGVGSTVNVPVGVAAAKDGLLFNLGSAPKILAYAVRNASLTVCDYMVANCGDASLVADATVWTTLASDIVSLRALYGRDTTVPMDTIVDSYDQITPGSVADVSGIVLNCAISRVQSARIVVLARNSQFEKTAVTANAPAWTGSANAALDVSKMPDGSANADWQNYRYKVFQTAVPLRNVVSLGVPTGC